MYELYQTGEKSYYINCPAKMGIYCVNDKDIYLIDSGNDKDAGKKVRKIIDKKVWRLLGILNTHSHADHIEGNQYLQQQTKGKVFSSRETIDKYQISFIYDVAEYLNTLERIKSLKAKLFVPAHAPVTEDITELAEYNINKVHEIIGKLLSICQKPICFEHILQKLFSDYGLTMTFEQYALVGSTIRSYLSFLKDNEKLEAVFENNMLLWRSR